MKKLLSITIVLVFTGLIVNCDKPLEAYRDGSMKAKWTEAKLSMPQMVIAQRGYKAANGDFATSFSEMGFSMISENQRYSYFLGDDVLVGSMGPDSLPDELDYVEVTSDSFIIYAVANLDADPDLDVWSINQSSMIKHVKNDQ